MIPFHKTDMYYTDYYWTDFNTNHPKISGKLDETKFNRNEGNEVLYLIHKIITLWDFTKMESCIKLERIIKEKLPQTVKTQIETVTWIQINWKSIEFKNMKDKI